MSENKRLLARYDAAVQNYARLLAKAIETGETGNMGYDLIEASVSVDQMRDLVLPYAEAWMLEYIGASTNLIRALAALANGDSGKAETAGKCVAAYEALRSRHFTAEDFASV